MPYITEENRKKYDSITEAISEVSTIETKGDLEYLIFSLMIKYKDSRDFTYSSLHDCTYAAAHCADEFRRRFLDKREDGAREANGDI